MTTVIYADRDKVVYGSKVVPDEAVPATAGGQDAAVEAARKWLAGLGR